MSKPKRVPKSCDDPIRWTIDHGTSATKMAEDWGVTPSYVYILQKFANMPQWKLAAKMAATFGWQPVTVMILWASRVTPKREKTKARKRKGSK